jgi:hypothetical protein
VTRIVSNDDSDDVADEAAELQRELEFFPQEWQRRGSRKRGFDPRRHFMTSLMCFVFMIGLWFGSLAWSSQRI